MLKQTLPKTIAHRVFELATAEETARKDAFLFLSDSGGEECRLSYGELYRWASAQADIVRERCPQGARVLIALPPGPEYLAAFLGTMLAGRIAVPLYPFKQNASRRRAQAVAADSQAKHIFCDGRAAERLEDLQAGYAALGLATLPVCALPGEASAAPALPAGLPESEQVAFLQYTSGSTRQPRGVVVRHGSLMRNIDDIKTAFAVTPQDRVVTWLPMYHDMGLIGAVLAAMHAACTCIHFSSAAFIQSPKLWLQIISDYRATISGGPNFAFSHCLQRIKEADPALDLSAWRTAFCGAEPIRPQVLEAFAQRFSANGFRRSALLPCYGLAEATLHVAGQGVDAVPRVLAVNDAGTPLTGEARPIGPWILESQGQWLVSCGSAPAGTALSVADPLTRRPLADGEVGEIVVAGPGIARGYWNGADPGNAVFERDAQGLDCLRTQDLGFLWGGEVFVSGRIKDVIVVYGRKYHAHDIEASVLQSAPALDEHGCVAMGMEILGGERLVVVAEVRRERLRRFDLDAIVEAVRAALLQNEGLQLTALVLARPRSVPKTSSGKLQRHAAKQMLLDGEFSPLACWSLLPARQAPAWLKALKEPAATV